LFLPLALLLLDSGPSGAFQNLRHPDGRATRVGGFYRSSTSTSTNAGIDVATTTTSWDARNSQLRRYSYKNPTLSQPSSLSATVPRIHPMFGSGVLSIQAQQRRGGLPFPLRLMAKDSDASFSDISNSKRVRILSKTRRILFYPFRKVATIFRRRKKPDVIDMKINGEVSHDDITSDGSSNDESLQVPTTTAFEAVMTDEIEDSTSQIFNSNDIVGDRWAVAAPSVDLTGEWDIKSFVTDDFKRQYDNYLKLLGQSSLVRSVAVSIVGLTTEETVQSEQGRELLIRGRNVRGLWERTLTASGADKGSDEYTPLKTSIITADAEQVEAEAWWEDNGTVHRSWLRGVTKYGGGEFESKRYLEDDGNVLVCESIFHPTDPSREKAQVIWRFRRQEVAA
jgi:hypothetical protein